MTPAQLHILQHALGVDQYGLVHYCHEGREHYGFMPNRNHFCAGGSDEDVCKELIALGYMKLHRTTEVYPYFNCSVTESGKEAVRRESPPAPKLSRSQKRYREFLHADTGYSFGEWLNRAR